MEGDDDKVFSAIGAVIIISGLVLGGVTAFEGYYHNSSTMLVLGATVLLFTFLIYLAIQMVLPPKPKNPNSIWNILKSMDTGSVLGKRSIGGGGGFTLTNRKRRL